MRNGKETAEPTLSRLDLTLVALFAAVVFSWGLAVPKTLNVHETVHCVNAREMAIGGDWIIPTYGGRIWLERPPLPFWIMAPFLATASDLTDPWHYRLPSVLMGVLGVLLTTFLGAHLGGRTIGLMAGVILTTSFEYFNYARGAEADIYLAVVVASAMACFVLSEFGQTSRHSADIRFFGLRPWTVLAFFIALGLTNVTKGLIFGTLHVLVPVGGFLLATRSSTRIRRYLWLPGWLAFVIAGGTWATLTYLRVPDVLDLWKSDYVGRLNQGAYQNPWWYYLANLPGIVVPWTLAAGVGLWACRPWQAGSDAEGSDLALRRLFVFCWAVLPPAFFSIPDGKHHHYLLHCMPAWAIVSALGARKLWQRFAAAPRLLRHPLVGGVLVAIVGAVALTLLGRKIPGPAWKIPALAAAWSAFALTLWWALGQRRGQIAFSTVAGLAVGVQWLIAGFDTFYFDRYQHDLAFLRRSCEAVPKQEPFFVLNDNGPLGASWFLHYTGGRLQLLHNETFLRDDRIDAREIYLIARAADTGRLEEFGTVEILGQSVHTRQEHSPADRFTLFRLQFRPDLDRRTATAVRISPMQATGRAPGPYLQ